MPVSRREFLGSAAALPVLTSLRGVPVFAKDARLTAPPYLALAKFIPPGFDEFPEEREAAAIRKALDKALKTGKLPNELPLRGFSPCADSYRKIAADVLEAVYNQQHSADEGWGNWVRFLKIVRRAEFYPLPGGIVRFEIASEGDGRIFYRVGRWKQEWKDGKLVGFWPIEEHVVEKTKPLFRDVTASSFANVSSFTEQLVRGIPYWRARLDPATGIDIYGSNGIAVGDIDDDGIDEVYVCQPGGLPNRLYKFGHDGVLTDITRAWKCDLLDDTSAALFIDTRNIGRQDLMLLRASGPILLLNEGGTFRLREDAFRFATAPAGSFTGMAAADFDRDGKLDLYLCCYVYFQSEAQYTYASPYHDAQNGPPNFLFRNRLNSDGSGFFEDVTQETGMNENNDRFSFAPAWCDFNDDGWPDLFVANDFGRKNLYVNEGGRFRDRAAAAGVEDIGPGMSAAWFDYDHDGKPDLYVANMWTDAGQRVVEDKNFGAARDGALKHAYERHAMGNSLYCNSGNGTFEETTPQEHLQFGRWAWSSGGHDLDNDGEVEVFITCGMLTNESATDLNSFFWRQVVAKSPEEQRPSEAYENGWNAINQFIREEYSWNGREPNVLHVRRGDRYFDFSGVSGLDFADDSRAFAVTDFDGDGRPDIILKSRLGPQVRVLQNDCAAGNHSIAFALQGTKSNRDAIGARIRVDGQTKWVEAGSGFLSQHSKRLVFGLGASDLAKQVWVKWPSGTEQQFTNLSAGNTYRIVEGSQEMETTRFREHLSLQSRPVKGDNELRLHDTWFLESIPLPTGERGPGVFILKQATPVYEIFRRYLFDWRTSLKLPFALLLNEAGHAVKVYGSVPSQQQVKNDLSELPNARRNALPFAGRYLNEPHRDFFKFGGAYLWSGLPEQALPYLQEVLRRTPSNTRVLVLVGQIHYEANRTAEAERCFKQAFESNPASVPALLGLGDVAAQRDQQAEAAKYYREAVKLDPDSAEAANGLGRALGKQGEFDEARGYLERAITLRRDYADAINNLGALYMQQSKVDDAIAAFEYGIRMAPDEDILYLNLGRTYTRLGNIEKARAVMHELLDRKPDSITARHALQELDGR